MVHRLAANDTALHLYIQSQGANFLLSALKGVQLRGEIIAQVGLTNGLLEVQPG